MAGIVVVAHVLVIVAMMMAMMMAVRLGNGIVAMDNAFLQVMFVMVQTNFATHRGLQTVVMVQMKD